jgi:hypothetical protein
MRNWVPPIHRSLTRIFTGDRADSGQFVVAVGNSPHRSNPFNACTVAM